MKCLFKTAKAAPKINYQKRIKRLSLLLFMIMITACEVGPNYVRPTVVVPAKFKEADKGWKIAQPQDTMDRGQWWCLFNDPQLNSLETQLNNCNQTIAVAAANYLQASALVDEARAAYFPTITGAVSVTRQKSVNIGSSSNGGNSTTTLNNSSSSTVSSSGSGISGSSSNAPFYSHSLLLDALWEPDLWGSVRRSVEASSAGAQASAALLANTRLSEQASLAEFYFELRGVDSDQKLLDETVDADKKLLNITQNRYVAGVDGRTDIVLAQTQLESAQAAAINNGINRALYEHAIAVLIGEPPADFSLAYNPLNKIAPPNIPVEVPSVLLERRPDVAQAERLAAQANAQIGVAIAAFFPTLNLSGTAAMQGTGLNHWFSLPDLTWSVGSQLSETLFDGGLRSAVTAAARATYMSNVASYRQTVLAAFQDVEDNLASLRILDNEYAVQYQAAASSEEAVKLVVNQYKAGTSQYSDVVTAMIISFADQKAADDVNYLRMTSAVGLIKALGGGWDANELDAAKD